MLRENINDGTTGEMSLRGTLAFTGRDDETKFKKKIIIK